MPAISYTLKALQLDMAAKVQRTTSLLQNTLAFVLETLHSIFAHWRAYIRPDALFFEINYA
ncbi:hypothetical protein FIBSPDRAFT_967538 [Athelia psychrophila]|uniref:Uncharacterized protein n=1 Tax=Athelia psychrophila TaxID=1759441 RepID=A0A167VLA5_9AGAM|nr:hypothetical protein FIBSPDRAFT_967538 [Fibularhizoctonia sp. CBS 109695]